MAVNSAGRRKDKSLATGFAHHGEERQCSRNVVCVVFLWVELRLADQTRRCEMQHGGDRILSEQVGQLRAIEKVANDQWSSDEVLMAGRQIIVDDGPVTRRIQRTTRVRADIARS